MTVQALAAVAGIVIADGQPALLWPFAISSGAFVLLAYHTRRSRFLLAATFTVFGMAHALRWQETFAHPLVNSGVVAETASVRVVGHFTAPPLYSPDSPRPEGGFLAEKIEFLNSGEQLSGSTQLKVQGRALGGRFRAHGGKYELHGKLSIPIQELNPTSYDGLAASLRAGVIGFMGVTLCREAGPEVWSWSLPLQKLAEDCRDWVSAALAVGIETDEDAMKILRTMALGTAERGTEHLQEPFRNSGTLHVFAVSGLHVGLIGVIGWLTLKMLGLRKTRALMLLIPLVFGYAFITGWRASAARAAFMLAIMVMAPLFNRRGRFGNALGAAALILLAADTHQAYLPGFQLSFLVLLAITLGAAVLANPFLPWARLDDLLPFELASWGQRTAAGAREWLVMLCATSVAAWIGSLPLMLAHFRSFTPIATLANLVLVPMAFVSLAAVVLSVMAAALGLTDVQSRFNNANLFISHAMLWTAEKFSAVPGGNFNFTAPEPRLNDPPTLLIPALGAGQSGQLLISRGEGWWLDCGSKRSYANVLEEMVAQSGLRRFGGMVLSHADTDHAGAAAPLFKRFSIPRLILPVHEPWALDSRNTTLWQLTQSGLVPPEAMQRVQTGQTVKLSDQVMMKVLHPSAEDGHDKADDRVMIVRMDVLSWKILWCSDSGFTAEKALLKRWPAHELKADVLIRGQHATDHTALPEFLDLVDPSFIIAADHESAPGESLPRHLRDYAERTGRTLLDLREHGFTTLRCLPDRLEASTFATRKEFLLKR